MASVRADILDSRFPGYRDRPVFRVDPFDGVELERRREVRRHPCYVHGYEVDEDIEVFFGGKVLILPRGDSVGWCVLETSGYSLASTRYDQDGRSLHATLSSGETLQLEHRSHHQKPGRRNYTDRGDLTPLGRHLRETMGYDGASDEQVAALVASFAREFGG